MKVEDRIKWYELKAIKPRIAPMLHRTKISEKLFWLKKLGIKNCIKLWMFERKILRRDKR